MAGFDQDPSATKQPSEHEGERHPAPDESEYLYFGKLGKAHGLHGGIILHPFNPRTEEVQPGLELLIWNERDGARHIKVETVKRTDKKGRSAVRLTNINSREQAETLRGDHIYLPWDSLAQPQDEGFYYSQLKGFEVFDPQGEKVGVITGVFEGATDIFVVRTKGEELLIPAVKEIVRAIEPVQKRILVDLPDDLRSEKANKSHSPDSTDPRRTSVKPDSSQ